MHRYFALIKEGEAVLSKEDAHHLIDVVRIKPGEKIEIVCAGEVFLGEICGIVPLSIKVLSKIEESRESDNEIVSAFAVLKGDHNDLIVEKGTELGAKSFLPFLGSRTIVKAEPHSEDTKITRLRKIAKEAAQQCRRQIVPTVSSFQTFDDVMAFNADLKLFAYEEMAGQSETLAESLKDLKKKQRILIVVGPEGGFTSEEVQKAKNNGFRFVSLGRRILRAETASIASLAIISAYSER